MVETRTSKCLGGFLLSLAIVISICSPQYSAASDSWGAEFGFNARLVAQNPTIQPGLVGGNNITWLSNGDYAVSWAECEPNCSYWAQTFDALSGSSKQRVKIENVGQWWNPQLAPLPNGAFAATWNSSGNVVNFASWQSDGSVLSARTALDRSPPLAHHGSISATANGAFMAYNKPFGSPGIYGATISTDGVISQPTLIAYIGGAPWAPSTAMLAPDLIAVSWGQFNNQQAYALLLNGSGVAISTPFPLGAIGNGAPIVAINSEYFVANVNNDATALPVGRQNIKLVHAIPGQERVIDVSLTPTTKTVLDFFHFPGTDFFVMLHRRLDQAGIFAQAVDLRGALIGPNARLADIDIINAPFVNFDFASDLSPEGALAMVWQDSEGRILTGVIDAYAVMSETLLSDIIRATAQTISAFAVGDLVRDQLLQRLQDSRSAARGGDPLLFDRKREENIPALPTSAAVASTGMSGNSLGGSSVADISFANGVKLFFAGSAAGFDTAQAGNIGIDKGYAQALTIGLDHEVSNGVIVGAAASYFESDVAQDYGLGGRSGIDGYAISAFIDYEQDRLSITTYALGATSSFETERNVTAMTRAIGETRGTQLQVGAGLSYEFLRSSHMNVYTISSLNYTQLDVDAYTEVGAGPLSASVMARSIDSLRGIFSAEVHFDAGTALIVPTLRASWNHEFSDDRHSVTAGFFGGSGRGFTTSSPSFGSEWASFGLGISGILGTATHYHLRFQKDVGRGGVEHQEVAAAFHFGF